jgi:hypothetical protein
MHVQLRRAAAAVLLAGAAALNAASCAENDSSIFVRGALVVSRTDCSYQVTTTPILTLAGSIDALYAGEYTNVLLVENQLVAQGNATTLRTETSGVQLYEAEVQVLDPSQNYGALTKYSTPVSGYADPSMSGQDGATGCEVLMIDSATLATLAQNVVDKKVVQTVVSSVVIKGRTLGGEEVHTQEFLFPIQVFYGLTCEAAGGMACISSTATTVMNDCRLGLDESTPCQNIAANLGACNKLECDSPNQPNNIDNAHCPAHIPPNDSCCGL